MEFLSNSSVYDNQIEYSIFGEIMKNLELKQKLKIELCK